MVFGRSVRSLGRVNFGVPLLPSLGSGNRLVPPRYFSRGTSKVPHGLFPLREVT